MKKDGFIFFFFFDGFKLPDGLWNENSIEPYWFLAIGLNFAVFKFIVK